MLGELSSFVYSKALPGKLALAAVSKVRLADGGKTYRPL